MLQLDYQKLEHHELEGEWNEAKEELFPEIAIIEKPIAAHRKNTLTEYKETILDLIN
jgi:hypothetical protein